MHVCRAGRTGLLPLRPMPLPPDHPYYKAPETFEEDPNAPGAEKTTAHFNLEKALEGLGHTLVHTPGHRSGFINIVGRPNVGKSTLVNALVGERMSIVTAKPQTTRHRIFALLSGDDFQAVFSDTPGLIEEPHYRMQQRMNAAVSSAFEDADVILFVAVPQEEYEDDHVLLRAIREAEDCEIVVVVNKTDTVTEAEAEALAASYAERLGAKTHFAVSALKGTQVDELRTHLLAALPDGPPYYPKDQLTDRPERFFVTEILREAILEHYYQEIPYSVQPVVEYFEDTTNKNGKPLARMQIVIYVERESQKNILIGKNGQDIKEVCYKARVKMEQFLGKAVFMDTRVKVRAGWRDDESVLKAFGY